jgi:hypothetical protein
MLGFIKLERAWTSLSVAETALHAHLSNHAWQHMGNTWGQWGLGVTQVRGDLRSYQAMSQVQGEAGYACERKMKCARGCMGVNWG